MTPAGAARRAVPTKPSKHLGNVEIRYMDEGHCRNVKPNGIFPKKWLLYDKALSADVLINVPMAKHHGLTKLTLAVKNIMEIMGGDGG
jgi:uncharacterized protein (DUF362 family)